MLTGLSLDEFAAKLASGDPTPGGGSASALVGALGASLLRMVGALTTSSSKLAEYHAEAAAAAAKAEALQRGLLQAVDEDVRAYDAVTAAYRMPKATDGDRAARSRAIQAALADAIGPPLRVVELSRDVAALAASVSQYGNPNAISDVGCAALCAQAAARGAWFNVKINANGLKDAGAAEASVARARRALAQVDVAVEVTLGRVRAQLGGD